jgi:hypothetical protein
MRSHQFRTGNDLNEAQQTRSNTNENTAKSTKLIDILPHRGHAKETMQRALAATRKRHAHLLAQKQLEHQNIDAAVADDETTNNGVIRQNAS